MGNQEAFQQVDWLLPKKISDETLGVNTKKKNINKIMKFLNDFVKMGYLSQENLLKFYQLTSKYIEKDYKLLSQTIFNTAKLLGKIVPYIQFLLFFLDLQIQDSKQSTQAIVNKAIIKRFSDEYIYILTDNKKMIELCNNKKQWQELINRCYEVVFFVETRYENNVIDDWKQMSPKEHLKKLFQVVSTVIFMKHIIQKVCKDKNIAKGQQWKRVTSLIQKLIQHILKVRGDYIRVQSIEIGLLTSIYKGNIFDDYQKKMVSFGQNIQKKDKKAIEQSEIMLLQSYKQQTLKLWKEQLLELSSE